MEGPRKFATKGVNGTLVVTPDRILIRRKRALLPLMGQGIRGSKEIAIDQISGTQLKRATAFVNGYIQFSLPGGEKKRGGFAAAQDEDSIMFTSKQQPGFEMAKELVDLYREAARNAAAEPSR